MVAKVLKALVWFPSYIAAYFILPIDKIDDYNRLLAINEDEYGNILLAPIFNKILIKENGYKFGNDKETISSALGKNKRDGNLLFLGKVLDKILDFLDKNHSIKSINENV